MGTISGLNTTTVGLGLPEFSYGQAGCQPVSLLAFLRAENLRLRNHVAELRQDITALREILEEN